MLKKFGMLVAVLWLGSVVFAQNEAATLNDALSAGMFAVTVDELQLFETFDSPTAWESYSDPNASLAVRDGVYVAERYNPNSVLWGQNTTVHTDVVMVVEATSTAESLNNGFGVACRAAEANNADGYYLRISADGFGQIFVVSGGQFTELVPWVANDAIKQGQGITNQIMAVCAADYLALYANGTLVAEVQDSTFSSGVAGMNISAFDTENTYTAVEFDNLEIWSATIDTSVVNSNPSTNNNTDNSTAPVVTGEMMDVGALLQTASTPIQLMELVDFVTFDTTDDWETYTLKAEEGNVAFTIADGSLQAVIPAVDGSNYWGLHGTDVTGVVIAAEFEQVSTQLNNGYGVICRADPENTSHGYYFRISGDGYYSIIKSTAAGFEDIVGWTRLETINQGVASNNMVAVCVGDYLALYVNGELVQETTDTTITTAGRVGLVLVGYQGTPVEIHYDNVQIWAAQP